MWTFSRAGNRWRPGWPVLWPHWDASVQSFFLWSPETAHREVQPFPASPVHHTHLNENTVWTVWWRTYCVLILYKCEQEPGSYSAFIEYGQVLEGVGQGRVVGGQGFLTNVKRPLVHVFGHLVLSPLRVQRGQVVERLRAVRMICTEDALTHLQGAAQEYLGGAGGDKFCNYRWRLRAPLPVFMPLATCLPYSKLFWR